jgi:hypothetical protein
MTSAKQAASRITAKLTVYIGFITTYTVWVWKISSFKPALLFSG